MATPPPKSNFLDVGFDWNEQPADPSTPMTLTYGFAGDEGESQDSFRISKNSNFTFTAFDLSRTSGVQLTDFEVALKKVDGDQASPFAGFNGGRLNPSAPDLNGRSAGLNAQGTGWGTPWQQAVHKGSWEITVKITASKDGVSKTWQADPELIVGGKGGPGGG